MKPHSYIDKLSRARLGSKTRAGETRHWWAASVRVVAIATVGLLVVGVTLFGRRPAGLSVSQVSALRAAGRAVAPVISSEDHARLRVIDRALQKFSGYSAEKRQEIAETLFVESRNRALDPLLVLAVATHESGFNASAVSHRGARGLMQIMPKTARIICEDQGVVYPGDRALHDPRVSIALGTYYLAHMRKLQPRLDLALTAYNMGPARLKELQATREISESVYSRQVMDYYRHYQRQYLLVALGRQMDDGVLAFSDAGTFFTLIQ